MKTAAFLVLAQLVLVVASCSANAPISEAPSKDYPCGVNGVVCADANWRATGMCCDRGEVCGGAPLSHCPAGECCFVGPDSTGFEARRYHPQRPTTTK